jgi:hypothetical protein
VQHLVALAVAAAVSSSPPAPLVPTSIGVAPSTAESAYLLDAPERRVRAIGTLLRKAVTDGLRRSVTFAMMLRALEDSDVIVQIVEARHLPRSTLGRVRLVPGTGPFRFLRIEIGHHARGDELIALIGHELLHAIEIARAPDVRDGPALAQYYRRIGFRSGTAHQFDTHAAITAQRRIRRELAGIHLEDSDALFATVGIR